MRFCGPKADCQLCPRLAAFRDRNREKLPDYHNNPVPSFASHDAPQLLIVGLAPGLHGANCTGRPFTNDYAGDLLYETLLKFGFAEGDYDKRADDALRLKVCAITNAVRCVPPENKPTTEEIRICNDFLKTEIASLPGIRAILTLGSIAHGATLTALGMRKSAVKFAHGATHSLSDKLAMFNTYHSSRYNVNTGRLTKEMFHNVVSSVRKYLTACEN